MRSASRTSRWSSATRTRDFTAGTPRDGRSSPGLEVERCGVHTVAQPLGGRSVVEHGAQVRVAAAAQNLGAGHVETVVLVGLHARLGGGHGEAGPAGARIELRARVEERIAARGARVRAVGVMVPVLSGEGAFGSLFAEDAVLLGRKGVLPLLLGLLDAAGGILDHGPNLPPERSAFASAHSARSAWIGSSRLAPRAGR